MEGAQGELCTWLADGLRCDDADDFSLLYHAASGEVAAVAFRANALLRFAGEYGTDLDAFDGRLLNLLCFLLADLFARTNNDFSGDGVNDVVHGDASEDALVKRGDDVFVVLQLGADETAQGAAVFFIDDDVVRDVDESAGEVSGVGRLEGGVSQTFSCTVGGNEVLQHGKSLFEVREDWVFDDLSAITAAFLRFGHQTTHAGELTDLFFRSTGAGVHHHIYGIEAVVVGTELIDECLGELAVDVRPGVDDLVVSLVVGDEAHVVVGGDLLYFVVAFFDDAFFFGWDEHVGEVEGEAALEGHVVTEVFDVVEELGGAGYAAGLDHVADDVAQGFLAPHFIDEAYFFGYEFVDHESADGGFDHVAVGIALGVAIVDVDFDRGVDVEFLFVVCDACLFGAVEGEAFAAGAFAELGDVIESEHHVLRGDGDGGAVGGVEDVVRGEHEHLRFEHGFVAEGQVDGHLVAVEVGVEGGTCQRVELDGFAFDHLRLEGLDAEAVEGGGTVEKYGVALHHVFQDVPHDGFLAVDDLLG